MADTETKSTSKEVVFTKAERKRLAKACQVLGVFFGEFVHDATMHALDEFEAGI
jgi:hypothetical protein